MQCISGTTAPILFFRLKRHCNSSKCSRSNSQQINLAWDGEVTNKNEIIIPYSHFLTPDLEVESSSRNDSVCNRD